MMKRTPTQKSAPAVPQALETDLVDLREEAAMATFELERLAEARHAILLNGSDSDLEAHDNAAAAATRRRDRAVARADHIANKIAEDQQREAAASRARRRQDADAAASAAAKALTDWFKAAASATHEVLRQVARADMAIAAVNKECGDDEVPLFGVEARARLTPRRPTEIVSEKRVPRWVFAETGNPISESAAAMVEPKGDNKGFLHFGPEAGTMSTRAGVPVEVRMFIERRSLVEERPEIPDALATRLNMPGLYDGQIIWRPIDYASPQAIISELDRLQGIAPIDPNKDGREERVELIPLDDTSKAAAKGEGAQ